MVQTTASHETDFEALTGRIETLAANRRVDELAHLVDDFSGRCEDDAQILLAQGVLAFARLQYGEALSRLRRAQVLLPPESQPELASVYTTALIKSQLALPRRELPATAMAYAHYKKNIAVLREVDPELAGEVQRALLPSDMALLEVWDGLYICSGDLTILVAQQAVIAGLAPHVAGRKPIGFAALGGGQELRYALEHRINFTHGMARAHYLMEPRVPMIRLLLHMFDLADVLRSEELLIFGGANLQQRVEQVFGSLRYPGPIVRVGHEEDVQRYFDDIYLLIQRLSPVQEVKDYYRSEEFRARQMRIARGEILPRVLVDTCRWTTFLKYCAADFEKAFADLGCATRFVIEQSDVQHTLPALHWREMDQFKPDFVFMVSHARPSAPYLPPELPVIAFVQDKCGPILHLPDLAEHISNRDLFICVAREFRAFVEQKGVDPLQAFVMPIPADETMFYPLREECPLEPRFVSDVGFVKHGHAHFERVLQEFLAQRFRLPDPSGLLRHVESIFELLYHATCFQGEERQYEGQMQDFVAQRLDPSIKPDLREKIGQFVSQFYIMVYSAAWRCQFLEAINEAQLQLSLYGGGWDEHARLAHLHKGVVDRERELNYVYNFNRINLSINHSATLHQRLSECGLAGGFMMVADHALDEDWAPARDYFQEGREVIFFDTKADLVDKCRYYLEHEGERQEIAQQLHRRAVAERTCRAGAETVLKRWRELLLLRQQG